MEQGELDRCACRIARLLYRCDEHELARAERELERLLRLAAHYRAVASGKPPPGERDSAAHLCRGDSPAAP